MANVMLRPDLKTAGGEVSDILLEGRYVGSLILVYREQDRVAGSVQLENESLPAGKKEAVLDFLQTYIQDFVMAVQAEECDVLTTYASFDRVITTDEDALLPGEHDEEEGVWSGDPLELEDNSWGSQEYELVTVNEKRNRIDYHVYDADGEFLAEVFVRFSGSDVTGEIGWKHDPSDFDIEQVTELLVSDFDEDEVDTFVFNHNFDGETVDTVELAHSDLIDNPTETIGEQDKEDDYSVVLVRDDDDALTYEIYQQSRGGLPIGTATVDIRYRRLTGFIDFRVDAGKDDVEWISTMLMRELDKEREYDGLNLTFMVNNEPFEEIVFDNERVH